MWTVPGGKLETTDYQNRPKDIGDFWYNVVKDVVVREVDEEVGLKVKNIRYLTTLAYVRSDGIPSLILSMYADWDSGDVKLCPYLIEYKWVTLAEAKDYGLISGIYGELKMLDEVLKGNHSDEWQKK